MELIITGCWGSQTHKWIRKAIRQINGRKVHQSPLTTKTWIPLLTQHSSPVMRCSPPAACASELPSPGAGRGHSAALGYAGPTAAAAGTHLHLPTAAGTVLQDKKASLKPHKLKLTTHAEILRIPAGGHLENTRAVAAWGQQNCEPPAAGGNLSNPPAARELLPASKDCPSARRLARMYGCPYPTEKYNLRSA